MSVGERGGSMKGMDRFVGGHREFTASLGDHERELLRELASGQTPDAVVVSCSDSRVIPELITQAGPGSLFVVRNVANLIPPVESGNTSVAAALDYAIDHLRVHHLIVLGHYGCGGMAAVRAAFADGAPSHTGADALPGWLAFGRDSWDELVASGHQHAPDWHDRLVEENVLQQLANAMQVPSVARALGEGRLTLHAWVYDLEHGHLRFWDSSLRGFVVGTGTGSISPADVQAEDHAR
jgi:carbonic anhydrase